MSNLKLDAIASLLDNNKAAFTDIVHDMLVQRASEVVDAYREEMAQTIFNNSYEIDEEAENLDEISTGKVRKYLSHPSHDDIDDHRGYHKNMTFSYQDPDGEKALDSYEKIKKIAYKKLRGGAKVPASKVSSSKIKG